MIYKEILQINKEDYGQLNFQKLDPKKLNRHFASKKYIYIKLPNRYMKRCSALFIIRK